MYKIGRDPDLLHEYSLRDMKRALKLTLEAHLARSFKSFVVVSDDGVCYDVEIEVTLRKK